MTTAIIALGTNIGDRRENLRAALRLLAERGARPVRVSSAWETPPMPAGQPEFLNAAVVVETDLDAASLLDATKAVERSLGRRPGEHWGPRPIDVDILFYDEERISEPGLAVPHPGVADRAFVLAPLSEAWRGPLPVLGTPAVELLKETDRSGLRRACSLPLP